MIYERLSSQLPILSNIIYCNKGVRLMSEPIIEDEQIRILIPLNDEVNIP